MKIKWKKSPELKKGRFLFFGLLVVFLLIGFVSVLHLHLGTAATKNDDSTVTIKQQPDSTVQSSGGSSLTSSSDAHSTDTEQIQQVTKHFVIYYYAYDQTNAFKNLADVRQYTDAGFFKELSDSQLSDTHPKQIGYREVISYKLKSIKPSGDVMQVQVDTVMRLYNQQKQKTRDVDNTVTVQLKKEKSGYKVFYVTAQSNL